MTERLVSVLLAGIVATGCEVTGRVGDVPMEQGDDETLADEASDSDGANTDSGPDSEGGSGDAESSTSADAETMSSDESDTTDTETGLPCELDPRADACEICTADLCCPQLILCADSPSCECMLDCLESQPPADCSMQCDPQTEYAGLVQCEETACALACG